MFSNPIPSEPRLSLAATINDDMLSALTPPLHCASILQPATPPQVVAFESWTISAPICLNRFTFAASQKSDLWTCVFEMKFCSSAFAFQIEMNFSFKSLFSIWSLSPQRFNYYFYFSIVSWQYQKWSTILILVLCLLCVTMLVCSSYSSFAPSSPFFSMMLLCCSLASWSFILRKSSFLSDDRLNSRMYSVRWFLLITMPSGLWFQNRFS